MASGPPASHLLWSLSIVADWIYSGVPVDLLIAPIGTLDEMTETLYQVVPQENCLFAVDMTPPNGRLRRITDFRDKADADAWIVQTERMLHGLDPVNKVVPRRHGDR